MLQEARASLWIAALIVGFFVSSTGMRPALNCRRERTDCSTVSASWSRPGTLHALGIGIGVAHRAPMGRIFLRAAGGLIALAAVAFLWRAIRSKDCLKCARTR